MDIAKGIAILLVIIGHTVKFGSTTRNFIFSFHMPLFFLLSGYTYRLAENRQAFWLHIRKGITHLVLPCILISGITIFVQWEMGSSHSFSAIGMIARRIGDAFWWASGVEVHGHPGLGAMWFLLSMFWAKIFLDGIHLIFPHEDTGYIYTFLGILGIFLGLKGKWLPQNMDVTCLVVFFMYLGMVWRTYAVQIKEYEKVLFFSAVSIWLICLHFNIYIELAGRSYPYLAISIIEAVCGSYAFCCFCSALTANRSISRIWQWIGMHTMMIFCIHCLDWIVLPYWYLPKLGQASCLQVSIVLLIWIAVYSGQYAIKRYRVRINKRRGIV